MKMLFYYETPIGKIGLAEEKGFITNLYFKKMKQPLDAKLYETDAIKEAYVQLCEYFSGKRKKFDIPINPTGTKFQQKVWCELINIPYGKTCTYKDIAIKIGDVNSVRAVGGANSCNPIPIIIPCHRVIGVDENMTGYSGGMEIKVQLLNIEKKYMNK